MWLLALAATGCVASSGNAAIADETQTIDLPTGKTITPTAARGAIFQELDPGRSAAPEIRAGQAAAVSVSPNGRTLAILTSGFNLYYGRDGNLVPELSTEYLFLFDISGAQPKRTEVLAIPNTYQGIAWAPSSDRLFASGGKDDVVLEFVRRGPTFAAGRTFRLGHKAGLGLDSSPMVGALAVSPDGTRLLVANLQNDSVSLVDLASGQVVAEQDLRPGIIDPNRRGQPGGSFPRCVVWVSTSRAYAGSERDREIISLAIVGAKVHVVRRIRVHGQPTALLANQDGSRLYAALDNTDQVAIYDTARDALIEEFNVVAPQAVYPNAKKLGGANSNALALSPDEGMLLVSNGGENALAVVRLSDYAKGPAAHSRKGQDREDEDDDQPAVSDHSVVIGLVPTGWYPTGVAISKNGETWYIVNGKSETGPNVGWCHEVDPDRGLCIPKISLPKESVLNLAKNGAGSLLAENQFVWQLEKAGFLTLPAPAPVELARLTKQVARNDHFDQPGISAVDEQLFSFLHANIKHVIYIIKENRSYDQVLGDLGIGNGDPRLTLFPDRLSPNHHAIARNFVTLDNFLVSGEVSWSGWDWSTAAQTNDFREREEPLLMGARGLDEDIGPNRNINMRYATSAERRAEFARSPSDPDILPGARDVAAPDGPDGEEGKGYLWDAILRQGLTVRNFGFFGHGYHSDYNPDVSVRVPLVRDPYAQKLTVSFPTKASLAPYTDPYYRGWEPAFPDFWRVREWKREFDAFSTAKLAPNLMLVQLGVDHFGDFDWAIDGVNTVETQMADNDYALGLIIEAVANSPFANNTLIVSIEDDACDGPDHVDAHRSVTLFAGPYVRHHAVVSTRYTTVSVVKTIEEILGMGPIGLNDALSVPMSDIFDPNAAEWSYKAIVPDVLRSTKLPLPPDEHAKVAFPTHSAAYWVKVMAGQDFSGPDRVNPVTFNRALWRGLKGDEPYPDTPTADLRKKRERLLGKTQPAGGHKNDSQK